MKSEYKKLLPLMPLLLGLVVSGCLKSSKVMVPVSTLSSSGTNAQVLACAQANSSNPGFVYYPSLSSCQSNWGTAPGACLLVVVNEQTCYRHQISGSTTGSATTSASTTGPANTTTGTTNTTNGSYTTGTCFVAGTQIEMADGSLRTIERVRVGDSVRAAGGGVNRVEKLFVIPSRGLKYSFNGGKFFVTASHPFLTEQGWKSLDPMGSVRENPGLRVTQLSEGDVVLTRAGSIRLHSIRAAESEETVFNFRTDGDHSYIADGYKVHNAQNKTTSTSGVWVPLNTNGVYN